MPTTTTRTTGVTVEVLDFTPILEQALETRRQERPELTSVQIHLTWARATGADGRLYLLCNEGVGDGVTDDDPILLDVFDHTEAGFSMIPATALVMTAERVNALPVTESKDLSEFIRTFGQRLEDNFREWFHMLTREN